MEFANSREELPPAMINAWRDIHEGTLASPFPSLSYSPLIDSGSLSFARYEQETILLRAFDILRDVRFLGLVPAEWFLTLLAKNPVPDGPDFTDVAGPDADMTEFIFRWIWITAEDVGMWWQWKNMGDFGRAQSTGRDFEDIVSDHAVFHPIE